MKPEDIKYEPMRQEKKPLWMHQVERHESKRMQLTDVITIIIIFAILSFLWAILGN